MAGKSRSARYYAANPAARKKKNKYNTKYHSTKKRKKYRAELNKDNRRRGTYGNGDGRDVSHTRSGRTVLEKASSNRARNGAGGKAKRK